MDEQRKLERSIALPCKQCGSAAPADDPNVAPAKARIYQVSVSCAACGRAFAALSRN